MHHAKSKVSGMIHKGFKAEKCKVAVRMAMSRMKLLRNKREVQIRQMRRDVAQLLQSGQDQTARIRVEHVIREEKTIAAYELLELYCELIVARLPIIDSQKTCPIDLQEAISSVIFASPRCADVQELMDVRKQFLSKYGKEFTIAALELRPDCGVSPMIIDKLSAKAPDIETKIKTLKSIAEEHGVEWDSKGLLDELQKPKNDLLTGSAQFSSANQSRNDYSAMSSADTSTQPKPTPFLSASQVAARYSATSSIDIDRIPSESKSSQFLSASEVKMGRSEDTPESYVAKPPDDQEPPHGGILSSTGSFIYPPPPPPFMRSEESTPSSNQPDLDDMSRLEKNKHKYKDAKEAARAAAESAERAEKAAKAAAEMARHEKKIRGKAQVEEGMYTTPSVGPVELDQKHTEANDLKMHNDQVLEDSESEKDEEEITTHYSTSPKRENEYVWDTYDKPSSVAIFDQGDSDIEDHSTNLLDTFSQSKEEDYTSSDFYWEEKADSRKQEDRSDSLFSTSNTKDSSSPPFVTSSAPTFDSDGHSSDDEIQHDIKRNEDTPKYNYDEDRVEKEESGFAFGMKNTASSDYDDDDAGLSLNFGKLTGGLRNKGYGRRPYIKKPITDATPSAETLDNQEVSYFSRTKTPPTYDVHEAEASSVGSVRSEKSQRGDQNLASKFDTNHFDTEYEVEKPENRQVQEIGRRANDNIIKQSRRTRGVTTSKIRKEDSNQLGGDSHSESSDEETTNESVAGKRPELDDKEMKSSVPPSTGAHPRRPPDYETLAAHFRSLRTNRS